VGREAAAKRVIDDMQRRLTRVQERSRRLARRLRTYIEIDRPYWTVSSHDFLSQAFALAGADNIFPDLKQQAVQVSPEVIVQRNPELIVSFDAKRPEIQGRAGWESTSAVRTGFIIDDLAQENLTHPSPQLVVGVEALITRIESLEKP
jgi:iron complex transport system substrate-binding protein